MLAHIALAPVQIFGVGPLPALGPAGAGWALVIPFGGGSILMIWYLCSRAIVRLNPGKDRSVPWKVIHSDAVPLIDYLKRRADLETGPFSGFSRSAC